jgi:acetate kinase
MVCDGLNFIGVSIDDELNDVKGKERIISSVDSKVKVLIVPTNEELMIARETLELVK